MIRIITLLLATLTILSNISAQNNTDSLINVYQMEPLYYTEKIGKDYFTVQNYFSKKKWFVDSGHWLFGVYDSVNNYGVSIEVENGKRNVLIKECDFLINNIDTINLKDRIYTVYITKQDSIVAEVPLEIKSLKSNLYYGDDKFVEYSLVHIVFEPLVINLETNQQLYFNTSYRGLVDKPFIYMPFVSSKKRLSYTKHGNIMKPIKVEMDNFKFFGNLVWQTRIKYRAY